MLLLVSSNFLFYYFGGEVGVEVCDSGYVSCGFYTDGTFDDMKAYERGEWFDAEGNWVEGYNDGSHGLFWTLCYNLIRNYVSVETDKTSYNLNETAVVDITSLKESFEFAINTEEEISFPTFL